MKDDNTPVPAGEYQLGASKDEQDRLFDHLESFRQKRLMALVRPKMRILDVGCGPGAVSLALARATGPEGRVVGVDMQDEQLERARAVAAEWGLDQARFERGDATRLGYADGHFDLVYAKFLLMHLPDPGAGLDEMLRVLKPGGVVFIYEVDRGGAVFHPPGTPTQRAWELGIEVLESGGSDPELGRKLYGMLSRRGLEDIRCIPEMTGACAGQARFMAACRRQITGMLRSLRERVLAREGMTESKLDDLIAAAEADRPHEFFTLCGMSCWGRKPGVEAVAD